MQSDALCDGWYGVRKARDDLVVEVVVEVVVERQDFAEEASCQNDAGLPLDGHLTGPSSHGGSLTQAWLSPLLP